MCGTEPAISGGHQSLRHGCLSPHHLLTSSNLSVLWDSEARGVHASQSPQISWSLFGSRGHSRAVPGWICSEKSDAFIGGVWPTATPVVGVWPVLPARKAGCEGLGSARVPHGWGGRPAHVRTPSAHKVLDRRLGEKAPWVEGRSSLTGQENHSPGPAQRRKRPG